MWAKGFLVATVPCAVLAARAFGSSSSLCAGEPCIRHNARLDPALPCSASYDDMCFGSIVGASPECSRRVQFPMRPTVIMANETRLPDGNWMFVHTTRDELVVAPTEWADHDVTPCLSAIGSIAASTVGHSSSSSVIVEVVVVVMVVGAVTAVAAAAAAATATTTTTTTTTTRTTRTQSLGEEQIRGAAAVPRPPPPRPAAGRGRRPRSRHRRPWGQAASPRAACC